MNKDVKELEKQLESLQSQIDETEAPYKQEIEDKKRLESDREKLKELSKEINYQKKLDRLRVKKNQYEKSVQNNIQRFKILQKELAKTILKFCQNIVSKSTQCQSSEMQHLLDCASSDRVNLNAVRLIDTEDFIQRYQWKHRYHESYKVTEELHYLRVDVGQFEALNRGIEERLQAIDKLLTTEVTNIGGVPRPYLRLPKMIQDKDFENFNPAVQKLIKQYRIDLINVYQKVNQ